MPLVHHWISERKAKRYTSAVELFDNFFCHHRVKSARNVSASVPSCAAEAAENRCDFYAVAEKFGVFLNIINYKNIQTVVVGKAWKMIIDIHF